MSGAEAAAMMKKGWVLLDVRPPTETERVPVEGAVNVSRSGEGWEMLVGHLSSESSIINSLSPVSSLY